MPHGTARYLAAFGLLLAATATAVRGGPIPVGIQEAPGARQGAPYLLDVCVVSGRRLPADGGVVMVLEGSAGGLQTGREIRVCCKSCEGRFLKEPAKYLAKVDELIIADQMARYPKNLPCLVMESKKLPDPSGSAAKDCTLVVYKNRLVRLCCTRCVRRFQADPAKYLAILDAGAIEAQKDDYPLTTCVVTGGGLRTNSPWFMIGDRAVRTCCGGCKGRAMKNPRAAVAKVDAARQRASSGTGD